MRIPKKRDPNPDSLRATRRRLRAAAEVFEEAANALGGEVGRGGRIVTGDQARGSFAIRYFTGGGLDHFGRAKYERILITVKLKWRPGSIAISRRKEFSGERHISRLERKLKRMATRRRPVVIDALTEIPGRFRLTNSAMSSELPADANPSQIVDRVRVMTGYLRRLADMPDDD